MPCLLMLRVPWSSFVDNAGGARCSRLTGDQTVRFIDGVGRMYLRRPAGAAHWLSGSERRGEDDRDAGCIRLVELDAGAVHWQGAPIGRTERARFGYMPEERGLYPRMRVRDHSSTWASFVGGRAAR